MKLFITGGAGFIGGNFILKQVLERKNSVLNYDKLTYAGNKENLDSIKNHNNYSFQNGDICDSKLIYNVINEFNPDSIINFAAESHVDRSIDGPKEFIDTNIFGTYELLNASLKPKSDFMPSGPCLKPSQISFSLSLSLLNFSFFFIFSYICAA